MKTPIEVSRLRLAVLPTPVYRLENLSARLGRNIYIKRDDLTGVALGGIRCASWSSSWRMPGVREPVWC